MNTLIQLPISGCVAPGFEPVRITFEENFTKRGEVGTAVHVPLDCKPVVDVWGGAIDSTSAQPWTGDTLVNVWSTTKGLLALAMHILADRGLLDLDASVARYRREFVQNGKDSVLVKHLLTHTTGLPAHSRDRHADDYCRTQSHVRFVDRFVCHCSMKIAIVITSLA